MTRFTALRLTRENWPGVIITLLFALYLIPLTRYSEIGKLGFVLLLLSGFFYLLFNPKQARGTGPALRLFFAVVIVDFLWIAFSYYLNGQPGSGHGMVWGRHVYLLFLIPLFYLFRRVEISDRVLVICMVLAVLLSLGDILLDLAQGIDHRLQGMNPNGFGPIQLCLSGMLLLFFIHNPGKPLRWVALGGFVGGIATVIFSQSKNTWMTLVVLSVVLMLYLTRGRSAWLRAGLMLVIALVLAGSYQLPMVKSRINKAAHNVARYYASDSYQDDSRRGTFGTRMELWKTGWKIFLEHPFLGAGVGNFSVLAKQNQERYQVNEVVRGYKYVHNQYIVALATRGIPGLILLLLLLAMPVYIAMKHKSHDPLVEFARLSIILICLNYAIGSIAEDHFEVKSATRFVAVMLPLLLARISLRSPKPG
jgi:O-antigen ligase